MDESRGDDRLPKNRAVPVRREPTPTMVSEGNSASVACSLKFNNGRARSSFTRESARSTRACSHVDGNGAGPGMLAPIEDRLILVFHFSRRVDGNVG